MRDAVEGVDVVETKVWALDVGKRWVWVSVRVKLGRAASRRARWVRSVGGRLAQRVVGEVEVSQK